MPHGPFVVLLSEDGANQATHGWSVREDAHDIGATSDPTLPISDCGCPENPPSFTTMMVGASTNAVNYTMVDATRSASHAGSPSRCRSSEYSRHAPQSMGASAAPAAPGSSPG